MFFYTFIPKLINMSLTASVAIVFVLLLRLLLKKAPKVISYALWGIVLFRLLCPVSIGSSLSLYNLFDAPTAESGTLTSSMEYVPADIVHTEYPSVVLPVPGVSDTINETLPQGEEQLRADPLEAPMAIATYVWMAGVLGMVIYSAVSYIRLRRKLVIAVRLRDNIYLTDGITSPFVMGLFRPKIYLPSTLDEREQSYILLHEQHHIRRLDHIVKALAFVALCIHWFNPLVWVAFILSGKDMEMSCDEAVVKKMGDGVLADYTASLLSLATGKRIFAGMPLAFGEGNTKGRIHNLANWKKPAFWVVLLAMLACVVFAVCLLTNPTKKEIFYSATEYSITRYLADAQQTEVIEAYNRKNEEITVSVNFESTESPYEIQLEYQYKKNSTNDWIYSAPVKLMLGETMTFTVPADNHYTIMATSLDGENGNVTFAIIEDESSLAKELSADELIPGTTYVSYQCIYMNPLSSYAAVGGDSGHKYVISENSFTILNRNDGNIVSINSNPTVDTAESTPVSYEADVSKWEWQEFPYTDEDWASLYWPEGFGMQNINEIYEEILYQPLENNRFLLRVDGDIWLVELRNNDRMGTYLWSIYSLVPESAMGVAQWEYAPMLSSRSPVFRFEFDMDYTEISAVSVDGLLVDWETPGKTSDHSMTFKKGAPLCWSPQDEDELQVNKATIHFTVLNGDVNLYSGKLYIEGAGGNSDGRPIYTAHLVGTGLHLEPNPEQEGGVITAVADITAPAPTTEHDLTISDLEAAAGKIGQYVFYTNSAQIAIEVESESDFNGKITLVDVSQNNAEILEKKVNNDDNECLFTGLTSARRYKLSCEGLDGCTLIVSGE